MVGGMKLYRVDPHAVTIEGAQFRAMTIGLARFLKGLVQPGQMPDTREMPGMTGPAHVRCPMPQRAVICPKVLIAHVGRHVVDLMGRQMRNRIAWYHDVSPCSETRGHYWL